MRLKNSIKLVFANFGIIYKTMLYKLILTFVLGLIGGLVLIPNFKWIIEESKVAALVGSGWGVIRALFTNGEIGAAASAFKSNLEIFESFLANNMDKMYGVLIVIGVLYFAGVFLSELGDYAVGEITDERMSSLSNRGFCVCLFKNLGKACLFSLIDLAITFVFTAFSGLVVVCLFKFTFKYIGAATVFFAILFMLGFNALRKTFLTDFMPNLVSGKMKIPKAFKTCAAVKKNNFLKIFSNYFTLNMFMLFLNVSFAVCTFFTGLLITIPMTTVIAVAFRFVNYYTLNGKKFYITYDDIITPKAASEDSVLMDKIDE